MTKPRIYLSPPHLDGNEKRYLNEAFDSNWITTLGPQVDLFEKEMGLKLRTKAVVALSCGTAALHMALILHDIGPGDEVVCSDLTFAATVNAIMYCGAIPIFIDSEPYTWNMDPLLLEEELEQSRKRGKTSKAVIVVDLYGQCADYDNIETLCHQYDVPLIEDAAEALGADYKGKMAGTFGSMGVLSFNGNKIITTSSGGMLISDDENKIKRARYLATQARAPLPYYHHTDVGYNYRMSNLLAAIGRAQLENLESKVEKRRKIKEYYRGVLSGVPGIEFMPDAPFGGSNNWLSVILVDPELFGTDRESLRIRLESKNIESRPVWKPMHLQPIFSEFRCRGGAVSERLFERGLCLPSGNQLENQQLDEIADTIISQAGWR